jgi:hypothetical protein
MWLHKIINKIKCKLSICCNSKCAYNTDLDEIIDDILHPESSSANKSSATPEEALRDKHYNYLDCPLPLTKTNLEILGKYKTDI